MAVKRKRIPRYSKVQVNGHVDTSRRAVEIAEQYPHVYAAVGWHPENCAPYTCESLDTLRAWAKNPKVVAIGEIGLDYYLKETMESLCPGSTWSCFGVGHCALEMLYGAVALGGHIRVGMEDNVMYAKGQLAACNAQFVERAARVIRVSPILSPQNILCDANGSSVRRLREAISDRFTNGIAGKCCR